MNNPESTKTNATLIEVNKLCNLFRIEKLRVEPADNQTYIYKASLYSDAQSLNVTWLSKDERKDLCYGALVRGEWITRRIFTQGTNIINSLQRVKTLGVNESIFKSVMPNWIYDGFAYGFIFDQIEQLPITYRRLVMQVLSSQYVLYHFLKTPISLQGDSYRLGSIFQKTAELLGFLCRNLNAHKFNAPREVLLTAAVLLGIGHYNKYKFDHHNNIYYSYELSNVHDPKIVAIGLMQKAMERNRHIEIDIINHVIGVIDCLEFEY